MNRLVHGLGVVILGREFLAVLAEPQVVFLQLLNKLRLDGYCLDDGKVLLHCPREEMLDLLE